MTEKKKRYSPEIYFLIYALGFILVTFLVIMDPSPGLFISENSDLIELNNVIIGFYIYMLCAALLYRYEFGCLATCIAKTIGIVLGLLSISAWANYFANARRDVNSIYYDYTALASSKYFTDLLLIVLGETIVFLIFFFFLTLKKKKKEAE
jgi:hypothetical protein